jgi:hypothetical protein
MVSFFFFHNGRAQGFATCLVLAAGLDAKVARTDPRVHGMLAVTYIILLYITTGGHRDLLPVRFSLLDSMRKWRVLILVCMVCSSYEFALTSNSFPTNEILASTARPTWNSSSSSNTSKSCGIIQVTGHHSGNIQGTFKEHSVHFREHSVNFREQPGTLPRPQTPQELWDNSGNGAPLREHSWNIQGTFSPLKGTTWNSSSSANTSQSFGIIQVTGDHSGNIQGTFKEHSRNIQSILGNIQSS